MCIRDSPGGSSTEEQRSQPTCGAKSLWAAVLLLAVSSVLTARCGDARTSPPWPQQKSLAAAPFLIFIQALKKLQTFPGDLFARGFDLSPDGGGARDDLH